MSSSKPIRSFAPQSAWKQIPIAVGASAPKCNDLIEFEELDSYSVLSPDDTSITSELKRTIKTRSRKQNLQRLKKREKLKKALLNTDITTGTLEIQHDTCKAVEFPNSSARTSSHKSKKKKEVITLSLKPTKMDCKLIPSTSAVNADMSEWSNMFVPEAVLCALMELGFHKPLPIQKQVLPAAIRDKRDILGAAETGSGKTLAFGIPLLYHILEDNLRNASNTDNLPEISLVDKSKEKEFDGDEEFEEDFDDNTMLEEQCDNSAYLPGLVLAPTRELAMQVAKHLTMAAKYTNLKIMTIVGGMASQKQIRLLNKQPDIVIATPGRLWELIQTGHFYLSRLHKLSYLVIDEADRMLEAGHFEDLNKLLDFINVKEANMKRQTLVFSATLTTVHVGPERARFNNSQSNLTKANKLSKLMKKIGIRSKAHVVDLTTKKITAEKLSEARIICDTADKDYYLYYFIKSHSGRTLVFTNSIDCIFRLSGLFEVLGCQPLHLHAKMQQRQRMKHLERFQANSNSILFASDVAARGLDIPDVKHVIHYQTPRTMETYIHRSGRAARSGKDGLSLMLVSPSEMHFYKRICKSLNKEDGLPVFDTNESYIAAVRKRVNLARDIDVMSHKQKKVRLHNDWFSKTAEAMDMELGEGMMLSEPSDDASRALKAKKQQLAALVKKPIFPKGFSGKFLTTDGEPFRCSLTQTTTKINAGGKKKKRKK